MATADGAATSFILLNQLPFASRECAQLLLPSTPPPPGADDFRRSAASAITRRRARENPFLDQLLWKSMQRSCVTSAHKHIHSWHKSFQEMDFFVHHAPKCRQHNTTDVISSAAWFNEDLSLIFIIDRCGKMHEKRQSETFCWYNLIICMRHYMKLLEMSLLISNFLVCHTCPVKDQTIFWYHFSNPKLSKLAKYINFCSSWHANFQLMSQFNVVGPGPNYLCQLFNNMLIA
jgi:hypothetical protein